MKTLGMLLASAGRTEVLRALMCQPDSVGLRQVARIAGVHPHTAELTLAALVREDLVNRRQTSAHPLYALNRDHPEVEVLEEVFQASARAFIAARSRLLDERAKSLLPFIRRATQILSRARETRHVA